MTNINVTKTCKFLSLVVRHEPEFVGLEPDDEGIAWWHHGTNSRVALKCVLDCGGDIDTVGAIGGLIAGATLRRREQSSIVKG